MHDIKAVRHTVDLPVRQVPENRPRFPYLQQRLWRLSLLSRLWRLLLLSRQWAIFPIFQQLVYFLAAPRTRAFSGFGFTIEQILAFPPRVIVAKPPSMSHEHGFEDPGSLSSWRYVVSSMHLTHPENPWTTCPARYP